MPTARRKKKKKGDKEAHTNDNATPNTTSTTTVNHHDSDHERDLEHAHEQHEVPTGRPRRRVLSILVGLGLVCYLAFFCSTHLEDPVLGNGAWDVLYLSNLVILIAAIGMIFRNPLIIGISISCVAYTHLCWFFDVFYWIAFDTWQVGRAKYLEEERMGHLWHTTLHQAWFIWVCMTVLFVDYPRVGIPFRAWGWSLVVYAGMAVISWFGGRNGFITDLITGHEFWQNTMLGYDTGASLPMYVGYSLVVEGVLLNGTCFIFLKLFSLLLLEDLKEKIRKRSSQNL